MITLRLVLFVVLIALSGCGVKDHDYISTLRYAKTALTDAVEIERHFGSCDHFITHYGFSTDETNTWNTEVFFGGRYELTMQVKIKINYRKNTFETVEDPKFYFVEVGNVDARTSQIGVDYRMSRVISIDEWKSLRDHDFDFSDIGIVLNKDPVQDFDSHVNAVRLPRVPVVSLLDD